MKKWMLALMACFAFLAFSAPEDADAKSRGGSSYKSGSKSHTPTKPADNATKTDANKATNPTNPATATNAAKPGLFGGGGFMKGLMLGGLAGMLFGGLFGGMGFLGEMLGLLINIMAIAALIMVIRFVYVYFRDRNKPKKSSYQE